jgi:hypothetical protein
VLVLTLFLRIVRITTVVVGVHISLVIDVRRSNLSDEFLCAVFVIALIAALVAMAVGCWLVVDSGWIVPIATHH